MTMKTMAAVAAIMLFTQIASAASTGDFAGLAICSKLKVIPKAAKLTKCNARAPLNGLRECQFTMTSNSIPIHYVVMSGVVRDKNVALHSGMKSGAPYGLNSSDTKDSAMRKVAAATGLSLRYSQEREVGNY